ncbi:hypothetical protein OEA41_001579 [Lepraria neglecta]|uniref:Uncharacterized protein n=1 Tax=Lepraria neglecta TaxID=209136 RepID=A0AAD9ZAC1_9LECA|nr:hypothetical protein OEA41_001579 [Lepraria neglecta]
MAVLAILLPLLSGVLTAYAQTCTTVQPVFGLPLDATSTAYASTITTTSSVDCDGCSLEVTTFRAIISGFTNPPQTTTITDPVTTSARFVCLPQTSGTTTTSSTSLVSAPPGPTPTASPLPPVTPTIQSFIDKLSTALLYTELFANGGNSEKLCSVINPSSLDEISGVAINGSAVQSEVCALGAIDFTTPGFGASIVSLNQKSVSYLTTALFAIQVAGNYAGGCNLATLCSEIEATLIDNIFINYILNVGTEVKDYVCSAASASVSAAPASRSPPYPTATANATACTTPTGFANSAVPAPPALASNKFQQRC